MSRRAFLAAGATAGIGGAAWLSVSSSWGARFIIPPAPHKPAPATWSDNAVTLAWLGHATVLINFYGVRILTDPALYSRIGVDLGIGSLGPLRLVRCALTPDELPDIDLVLVSHAHFDHLDTPSLGAIRGMPAALMGAGTSDLLPRRPYSSIRELRWNEAATVTTPHGDLFVRAIEVKHWGARVGRDTWRGYTGWIVEREGRRLLIGGDTAVTSVFNSHRRFGPFDAAVMPIGAYNPYIHYHCTPEQAVAMADAAGARAIVPVHHQSFQLSHEPFMEPIERIQEALVSEHDRLALHVALSQFAGCSLLQGGPSPKAAEKEETPRSKAVLIALLKESTTFCNPLVNAMTDEGMVQLMKVGPNEGARGLLVTGLSIHGNEVYGTIAVYLRLKGIVPPTTARQKPAAARGN